VTGIILGIVGKSKGNQRFARNLKVESGFILTPPGQAENIEHPTSNPPSSGTSADKHRAQNANRQGQALRYLDYAPCFALLREKLNFRY
jgi:hypothetical protein